MTNQANHSTPSLAGIPRGTAIAAAVVCLLTTVALQSAQAQTYTVIHKFSNGGDGATPEAGLTLDAGGNLYGTTGFGGYQSTGVCQADGGCGVVFRLSHHGTGWTITGLYQFLAGDDGDGPLSRVVFGPDGALYGTTQSGGGNGCTDGYGCGTVYRLTPPARLCTHFSCEWSETVLHAFTAGADGRLPYFGDLTFDTAGDIFGTTALGGIHNDGTLYKVSRQGEGWTESVAYTFGGAAAQYPAYGVVFDSAGNIYGTAGGGGPYDDGLVYELQPFEGGWTENTLFTFTGGANGAGPGSGLIFDRMGNLYGATVSGGPGTNGGTVYQLVPSATGWTLTTLTGIVGGSGGPNGSLTMDAAGNLYGTTYSDGAHGYGSVFKVAPQTDGTWLLTDLYDFTGFDDGGWPIGNVTIDASGNLWGTASRGGDRTLCSHLGCGVIWEITP
jgi:uncharacterized repeat protein (TIGR03803 family)